MFDKEDFRIFEEETLSGRMDQIRRLIDPKFEAFAKRALPILQEDGQVWYAHVAQHKMRKTNAPDNTWVAFAPNKRGYKMLPHFELGLWADHLYFYLAVEENMKPKDLDLVVPKLHKIQDLVANLPKKYSLSLNHMVNSQQPLAAYSEAVDRYARVKSAEVLVGLQIPSDSLLFDQDLVEDTLLETLKELLPLYEQLR